MQKEIRIAKNSELMMALELAELGKKARIIFHDLSNHITALTLSVGQLEQNLKADTRLLKEHAERSKRTRVQMEYIASLLRSHIEHRPKSVFDPNHEITKIIRSFSDRLQNKLISIEFNSTNKTTLLGDVSAFISIFTNLISNAIESFEEIPVTKIRPRKISVSAKKFGQVLEFLIQDSGCGIPQTAIKRIFDQEFTTKPQGHGIGLFTTKEYIEEKFYGSIDVESSENGTKFIIKIPMRKKFTEYHSKQNRKQILLPVLLKSLNLDNQTILQQLS